MENLAALRLFVSAAQFGNFSAVGRREGLAPSSVSRQISALEGDIGVRLFNRTTRKLSLTEAGALFLGRCERILAELDEARSAVATLAERPSGLLRVTAPTTFALRHIAPLVAEFSDQYPRIQISLSAAEHVVDLVASGFDLAIRFGHLTDSSLKARRLAETGSFVCASPLYLKRFGVPSSPQELRGHRCLSFRLAPGENTWKFKTASGIDHVRVGGPLQSDSADVLLKAAECGAGIVLLPTWMVGEPVRAGHLQQILGDFPIEPVASPIHALFADTPHLAPKVRVFVDFLVEAFSRQRW